MPALPGRARGVRIRFMPVKAVSRRGREADPAMRVTASMNYPD
jgi:hypothetical protein